MDVCCAGSTKCPCGFIQCCAGCRHIVDDNTGVAAYDLRVAAHGIFYISKPRAPREFLLWGRLTDAYKSVRYIYKRVSRVRSERSAQFFGLIKMSLAAASFVHGDRHQEWWRKEF